MFTREGEMEELKKSPVALVGFTFRLSGAELARKLLAKAERHRERTELITSLLSMEALDPTKREKIVFDVELAGIVPRHDNDPESHLRTIMANKLSHERTWKRLEWLASLVHPEDEYTIQYGDAEFLDADYTHVPYDL